MMDEAWALMSDFGVEVRVTSAAGMTAPLMVLLDQPPESFGMVRQAGYEATLVAGDAPWLADGDGMEINGVAHRLVADPQPIGDGVLCAVRVVPA